MILRILNIRLYFQDCSNRAKNDMKRAISDLENECLKYDEALQDLTTKRNITAYDADSMRNKLQQLCVIFCFLC